MDELLEMKCGAKIRNFEKFQKRRGQKAKTGN
jgi:hypothetical protein